MTVKDTIKSTLENDAEMAGYLTGGVYALAEIKRTDPACEDAFDEFGEILPSVNLRVTTTNPTGPTGLFEESFISLFYYQYRTSGTAAILSAAMRGKELLHNVQLEGTFQVFHVGRNPDLEDEALEASLIIDRYRVAHPAETP